MVTIILSALRAILSPAKALRHVQEASHVSYRQLALLCVIVGVVDLAIHPYLLMREWSFMGISWSLRLPRFAAWACLLVDEWLLGTLTFLWLNHVFRGPRYRTVQFALASFYLVFGVWVIAISTDTVHFIFRLPRLDIDLPWLAWFESESFTSYKGRLSHLLIFPWLGYALWTSFRLLCGARTRGQLLLAASCSILLPFLARLLVEPLPNLLFHLLDVPARSFQQIAWVNLGTYVTVAALTSVAIAGCQALRSSRRIP